MTIQEIRKQIEKAMQNRNVKIDNNAAANLALNAKSSDGRTVDGGVARIVFCACKGSAKNLQFCLSKQNNNLFKLKLEHCGKDFERFLSGRRFDYEITGISGDDLDSIWTALQQAQKWYNDQDTRNNSSIRKLYEEWKSTQNPQDSKSSQKKTSGKNKAGEQQPSFEDALNKEWGQVQKLLKEIDESSHDVAAERLLWKNPEQNPFFSFTVNDKNESFVLNEKDSVKILSFNNKCNDDHKIHLEAPPQPYIGDPLASIWLLLMNPSYSAVDIYDFVSERKGRDEINEDTDCINAGVTVRENASSLNDRRALLDAQYSFSGKRGTIEHDFYVLSDKFKTIAPRDDKKKHFGSYEWWSDYLYEKDICSPEYKTKGGNTSNLKNFFVLESFPYHSRKFGDIQPWFHSESYFLFWVKMVAYALCHDRILLCRGEEIAKRVHDIAEKIGRNNADANRIFICTSSGSFSVSNGNFISYKEKKKIDKIESEAKADFVIEIDKKLEEQQPRSVSAGA